MTKDEATSANGVHIDSQLAALTSVPENGNLDPFLTTINEVNCPQLSRAPLPISFRIGTVPREIVSAQFSGSCDDVQLG